MIPLGPITSTLGTVYTSDQVQSFLFGSSLTPSWYFDLLGPDFAYKTDLNSSVDFSRPPIIDYDSTRAVKRTLRGLTIRAQSGVDQQRDLIRVRFRIPSPDGGYLEWQVGTFMMQTPKRVIYEGITWWTLDAPDLSQKLARAAFGGVGLVQSTSVGTGLAGLAQAGSGYPAVISALVASYGGITPLSADVPEPANKIPADLVFDIGSSYLKAINDLLAAIVYTGVYATAGVMTSRPLANYAYVQTLLTLDTIAGSAQLFGPFSEAVDPSTAFNKAFVLSEDPRRAPIKGYYENTSPDSAVSLVNADPFLTVIRDSKIASELAAFYRARAVVQEAARVYAVLSVGIPPFPFFEDLDVVQLVWQSVDEGVVNQPYLVLRYQHTCGLAATTLDLQRVVPV